MSDEKAQLVVRRNEILSNLKEAINEQNVSALINLVGEYGDELLDIEKQLVWSHGGSPPENFDREKVERTIEKEASSFPYTDDFIEFLDDINQTLRGDLDVDEVISSSEDKAHLKELKSRLRWYLGRDHYKREFQDKRRSNWKSIKDIRDKSRGERIEWVRRYIDQIESSISCWIRMEAAISYEFYGVACLYAARILEMIDYVPQESTTEFVVIGVRYERDELDDVEITPAHFEKALGQRKELSDALRSDDLRLLQWSASKVSSDE